VKAAYAKTLTELEDRIATNRRQLDAATAPSPAATITSLGGVQRLQQTWRDLDQIQQRQLISALIERIDVMPPNPPTNRYNPDRVVPFWRL
jgi:hypothetical protein